MGAKNVSFTIQCAAPLTTMLVRGCDTMNRISELRLEVVEAVDAEHMHYAPKPDVQSLLGKLKADLACGKQSNELADSLLNGIVLAARDSGDAIAQAPDLAPSPSLHA